MNRALLVCGALVQTLALPGCSAPVMTRIETVKPAALPASASFALVQVPDDIAPVQMRAIGMVAGTLTQRGWRQTEAGDFLVWVTLSDRPARTDVIAGDALGKSTGIIAAAASRSNNRGCAKHDQRLTVTLANRATGDLLYAGTAAEYHCNAPIEQSLPALVASALAGMDGPAGVRTVERAGAR